MPAPLKRLLLSGLALLTIASSAEAQTIQVATESELRAALTATAPTTTIQLIANITLTGDLPAVSGNLTIDGAGHTLSGDGQYRGLLFVAPPGAGEGPPQPITVTVANLTIANTVATGGAGGAGTQGGGGGAGLGGALSVGALVEVTVSNVFVVDSRASGGNGGAATGPAGSGGGGGLGGNGGSGGAGGGGGAGLGANGGAAGVDGGPGILTSESSGGGTPNSQGGASGGGGGGSDTAGGGGGAGGGFGTPGFGGYGGTGGGGGGGVEPPEGVGGFGGNGGFGGGGGAGTIAGGVGGFGAGGGGATNVNGFAGDGGTGGGAGSLSGGGGGGAGLGGAIFVQNGGSLNFSGPLTINGSQVTAGLGASGGGNGSAAGAGLYLAGSGTVGFNAAAGQTMTVADAIVDGTGAGLAEFDPQTEETFFGQWALRKSGAGTLVLGGTNAYAGGTAIVGGTLSVARDANLGVSGTGVSMSGGSTLAITGTDTFARALSLRGTSTISLAPAATATWSGVIGDNDGAGGLRVDGGGTLALTNNANTYSGGTTIRGDSTVRINGDGALGAAAAGVALGDVSSRGTLAVFGDQAVASTRAFTLGGTLGGVFDIQGSTTMTLAGSVVGSGSLTKAGSGTLALASSVAYTGATIVEAGTLRTSIGNVFAAPTALTVASGATFDLNGFNQSVGSIDGAGRISLGAGTLTMGAANTSSQFGGTIDGAGMLIKTGSGVTTLTGANTYTGGTLVSGGALVGSSTSLQGAIANNASVGFDQTFDGAYAGVMSGTGSFVKSGTGTLALGGANTYTGGTLVSGGTLAGTTTSLQGAIVNNASVAFDQGFNGAYNNVMSGTGSLVKSGAGTLVLGGANTYTGGTLVSGGTLVGTTTSLQGNIANNATVVFDQAAAGTYAGAMNGTGSLVKNGAGTVVLGGANTYSGGTLVSAGALVGTSLSLQGAIVNNASVGFDQAFDGAYSGAMSGTGSLVKSGTGTLVLGGANSYTGGTFVSGGALLGTSNSLQGGVVNNASVGFDQNFNGVFNSVMSGTGSLVKSGSGSLVLGGANTYTGGTLVTGGSLIGTTTSLQGAIVNNANVAFDQGFNGAYTSVMSGTGSLVKSGAGTLVLGGANTYSGGTLVAGGTLVGTTTSLQGAIANNATVVFDQASAGTYAGAMSGTGALVKSGDGTLVLGGSNSYGGGTLVSGGALVGTSASLQGAIVNNASVAFDQGFSGAYNGAMSGSGSLVKSGGGTLVLGGSNSYSGGTFVSGGTLIGTTNSLGGSIVNDATVVFDQGFSGTFGGTMTGRGALVKSGAAWLTLTGANAYSGGTIVSGGTLAGTTASLNGHILNNAEVVFNAFGSGVYAGAMGGSGRLTIAGTGAVRLTGANTYTGGTFVHSGTLIGTTSSLQGSIETQGRVVFDQAADGAYAGVVTGSGIFEKTGSGALTIGGSLQHTGGTLVRAGTLIGTTDSLRGLIENFGTVTFGGPGSGIFQGTLVGPGALNKIGTGTLTLNGVHPMTGLTTVAQGALVLDGTLGGDVTVASGATFQANGAVGGSLTLNGTLVTGSSSTGASALTMAASPAAVGSAPSLVVGGNLTTLPGASITLPIGPGAIPSIQVGGGASLSGLALNVGAVDVGTARNVSFLALTAGSSLNVANASVSTANPQLVPAISRRDNSLFVTLLNLGVPLGTTVSDPQLASVATALDALKRDMSGDRGAVVTELLALDAAGFDAGLRQVAGELYASSRQLSVRSSEAFTDMVRNTLNERDYEGDARGRGWGGERVRWWGQFTREHGRFESSEGAVGGVTDLNDTGYGFDYKLAEHWLVGGGGGFGKGSMGLDGFGASTKASAPRGYGVLGFKPKGFSIRGGGSVARSTSESKRNILLVALLPQELGGTPVTGGLSREPTSEEVTIQSDQWTEYAGHVNVDDFRFDVMFGARRARFSRGAFSETGAGALSLQADDNVMTITDTDVKIQLRRIEGRHRPYFETMVRHSSGWPETTRLRFAEEEASEFEVRGLPLGSNALAVRTGLNAIRKAGTFTFEYRFRKAAGQFVQALDLRYRF
jgi:autotransporter-associated beta strand protein